MSSPRAINRRLALAAALLIVASPGAALSPDRAWREAVEDNPFGLAANVDIERTQPLVTLHIKLKNNSSKAVCVGVRSFQPVSNGVLIWDANDRHVGEIRVSDPIIKTFRGMDYAQAYYFLFSGKSLDFDVDLMSFSLQPGRYLYRWFIPYHVCGDVVALDEPASVKPEQYFAFPTGYITIPDH